ncbi:hypothetical protein SAMN05216553_106218 [Lentzea fradiae]|uniref:Lipoprotein n=1 Tax=Lentzea fradiae TaxID=200378 RepID=A0A1G7SEX6_9PSEU|nr:hypothetical protein [Lentzea fradiae]SDG21553.1 hypothetical protein SAMN05216553_106218 [Lentzea fradiae]
MRLRHIALLLAAVAVVAGCTTRQEAPPKVATLETGQAGAPSAAAESAKQTSRPRFRLDMTPEEQDRLSHAYDSCLNEHIGFTSPPPGSSSDMAPAPMSAEEQRKYDEVESSGVCLDKKPLPAWEYDVANPEAVDFAQKVVRCLRDKGVRYVEVAPAAPGEDRVSLSLGGEQNDSASISEGMRLIPQCEKELAAGGSR